MHKILSLLSFVIVAILFSSEAFAAYDYIKVGKIYYEVSYGDDGPYSATAYRLEDDDLHNPTTSITIPDYISYNGKQCPVTTIKKNAFYYNNFKDVTLGSNLRWIGEYAFNNSYVDKLVLPASLITVYAHGIPHCNELFIEDGDGGIEFFKAGGLTTTGQDFNLDKVKTLYLGRNINSKNYQLFKSVSALTIGDKVTRLADNLFREATELSLVKLPANLEEIGMSTFYKVPITTIEIPPYVKKIGQYAFAGTSLNAIRVDGVDGSPSLYADTYAFQGVSFANAYFNRNVSSSYTHEYEGIFASSHASLQSVEIGDNATSIGFGMFQNCYSLNNASLGKRIVTIESSAFSGCSALGSLIFPESIEEIGEYAFFSCSSLTNLNLPSGITKIGNGAFRGCAALNDIHISSSLDKIGLWTFQDCSSLKHVEFEGALKLIESEAFSGCSALKSLKLPEGLERIQSAFKGCTSLAKVEFPSTFKTFQCSTDDTPFKDCYSIREVICYGSKPAELGYGSSGLPFEDEVYKEGALRVPDDAIDKYKTSKCWQPFYRITEVKGIADGVNKLCVAGNRIVSLHGGNFNVSIVSIDGRVLYFGDVSGTPELPCGIYLAAPEGNTFSKFVIR